jgi:hypothetical protein
MIFLNFGTELINLSQVYQIDLKNGEAGVGVQIAFFYHLAGTTSGGYKVSKVFANIESAKDELRLMGVEIKSVPGVTDEYYDASQVPTGRINTRIEPTRRKK